MRKPKPGHFRGLKPGERPLNSTHSRDLPEGYPYTRLEVSDVLVRIYQDFVAEYGMPRHVLYPGCGYDISPSQVFPRVTYVDQSHYATDPLSKRGFNVHCNYLENFRPEILIPGVNFDLMILMRFPSFPDNIPRLLESGYLICDHYRTGDANNSPYFEFVKQFRPKGVTFQKGAGYFLFRRTTSK